MHNRNDHNGCASSNFLSGPACCCACFLSACALLSRRLQASSRSGCRTCACTDKSRRRVSHYQSFSGAQLSPICPYLSRLVQDKSDCTKPPIKWFTAVLFTRFLQLGHVCPVVVRWLFRIIHISSATAPVKSSSSDVSHDQCVA